MADLKRICKSPLNLKIISFFHENRSTVDTPRNIAAWLDHDQREIEEALDYLVRRNVLTAHQIGSTIAYAYTQNKELVKEIEKILQKNR